jgi:hypothetical protein
MYLGFHWAEFPETLYLEITSHTRVFVCACAGSAYCGVPFEQLCVCMCADNAYCGVPFEQLCVCVQKGSTRRDWLRLYIYIHIYIYMYKMLCTDSFLRDRKHVILPCITIQKKLEIIFTFSPCIFNNRHSKVIALVGQ